MKLKIEKVFKDKVTGEYYNVGDVIEVAEKRGKELLSDDRKLVSLHEEKPKTAPKKSTKKK